MEYLFNFDGTFEIHDDIEVLKRMGLALGLDRGECEDEDVARAKSVLPKALGVYVDQIAKRSEDWRSEFGDLDFEESYYGQEDGEDVEDNGDMDDSSSSALYGRGGVGVSGISDLSGLVGVGGVGAGMSVEDYEMEAAIQSLHPEGGGEEEELDGADLVDEDELDEAESYGDEEEPLSE